MKVLKWIGIVVGGILVLGVVGLWLLSSVYKDEVEAIIVEQINQSLKTKVDVGTTNFSLIRKFPYASLEFEDVTAYEVSEQESGGVLFQSASIFLKLHLLDLLRGKQTLERIEMTDAVVNLRVWKDGTDNYHFWSSTDSSSINTELNNVHLSNVSLYYINDLKDVNVQMDLEALDLSGNLSDEKFTLKAETQYFIHNISAGENQIVSGKSVWVSSDVEVNNKTGVYTVHASTWKIEDIKLVLSGTATETKEGVVLDLASKGSDIELETVVSLLPATIRKKADAYDLKGNVTYNIGIAGLLSNKVIPRMDLEYQLAGASISHAGVDMDEIQLAGTYTNGKNKNLESSAVKISTFSALLEGGQVRGNLTMNNLAHPTMQLSMHLKGDLENYEEWLSVDTVEYAEGKFEMKLDWKGRFNDISNPQAEELKGVRSAGFLRLEHAGVKFESFKYMLEELNGSISFNNERWMCDQLTGVYGSTDVEISGWVDRVYQFIFSNKAKLLMDFKVHSKLMELEELFASNGDDGDNESKYKVEISEQVEGKVQLGVDELIFGRFSAQNIRTTMYLKDKVISGRETALEACGGSVAGLFDIDNTKPSQLLFTTEAKLTDIDIERLFYEFNNFGQEAITDQHLNGKANAEVEFATVWNSFLEPDLDRLYASADLDIKEGRLKDYEPLMELSKFIEVEELMDVRFSRMQTNVVVSKRKVHIPQTSIQSSALNLVLSGTHSFNNELDYQFVVRMKDVLSNKARKAKKENSEFGIIEDDGLYTRLYLRMTGTVDEPEFKYDRQGVREKWKEDMQREKKTIKGILKDEFNWFSNDTTVSTPKEKEEDSGFEIEWEDTPADTSKNEPKNTAQSESGDNSDDKKDDGKLKKWLNKISKPNEDEYEDPPE